MLRTRLQFGTVPSEDLFYTPVKATKNQKQAPDRSRNDAVGSPDSNKKTDDGSENGKPKEAADLNPQDPSAVSRGNLERFVESTTPSVPAQYLSKITMRGWQTCDVEFQPYFTLGDMCESFREWSAYGKGVPLTLDGRDRVVQYYVPYLSGIQLYCPPENSHPKSRSGSEDSDSDYYKDSSSGDDNIEPESKFSRSENKISFRMGGLSVSTDQSSGSSGQEGFSSDDSEAGNSRGRLLFEYLERDPPHRREPLADKIMDLAGRFKALNEIRSCDLLPFSWISIAWYPIYRIPTGSTLKDLDACFLMYHTLSTPMDGSGGAQSPKKVMDGVPKIRLPVIGMATYKFTGSMWTQTGLEELHRVNSLRRDADNWLKLLGVSHPDFRFFASHSAFTQGDPEGSLLSKQEQARQLDIKNVIQGVAAGDFFPFEVKRCR
ncbi:hypothetical protein SAY87_003295 [Trapa incisa]|uniref:Uncharacterized protein n=1 Tax=Trapa incisa TaxID=236973 RepID=A0AAN7QHU1_9MYRT|nr:hypothetical protein SAY87_003295 [Trapa incisa]